MASGGGGPGPGGGAFPGGHGSGGWRQHGKAALYGFATGTTGRQQAAASRAEREEAQLAELAAKRAALMCCPNPVRNDPPSAAVVAQMPLGFPVLTGFSAERLVAEERARLAAVVAGLQEREREMTLEMERPVAAYKAAFPTHPPAAAAGDAGDGGAAAAAGAGGVASPPRGSAAPGALLPPPTTLAAALAEARREQGDLRQAAERRAADGGDADRVAATHLGWAPADRRAADDDDSDGEDESLFDTFSQPARRHDAGAAGGVGGAAAASGDAAAEEEDPWDGGDDYARLCGAAAGAVHGAACDVTALPQGAYVGVSPSCWRGPVHGAPYSLQELGYGVQNVPDGVTAAGLKRTSREATARRVELETQVAPGLRRVNAMDLVRAARRQRPPRTLPSASSKASASRSRTMRSSFARCCWFRPSRGGRWCGRTRCW